MLKNYIYISACLLMISSGLIAQSDFFMDEWEPEYTLAPDFIEMDDMHFIPEKIISVDFADTLFKISPHLFGFNQPAFRTISRRFYDQPELVRHIRNLSPQIIRYPGGTAAMSFFWDRNKFQVPPNDVQNYMVRGEVKNDFGYGVSNDDIFTLDSYYNLIDSIESARSIIVINYGYARYGLSDNPVQKAAQYAADWVRYDNGRTKFWEIGNELDGIWTPGNQIDVTKNKDGQPEFLTGSLYAQHFRVFVDSMRAAAQEIDSEIKIGAVLTHREGTWNKEFLENASDIADFGIIHHYYGSEGDNSDPLKLINQARYLSVIKGHTDEDIQNFSSKPLPVFLTEWNTRDVETTGMCINGVSNIFALKNIIESGYGMSVRHTLIQNIPRGLINLYDYWSNQGLAPWQPRSTFFYYYYLSKFLGDTYFQSTVTIEEHIEVLASSFSSGQAGLVILNKGTQTEKLALNMLNFQPGLRYFWYTLSPENDDPFSNKVFVNGQSNSFYPGGGPLNYEEVKSLSTEVNGAIKVEVPPYSVSYMLVEGQTLQPEEEINVNFTIYGQKEDSVFLLENTFVNLNNLCGFTNSLGALHLKLPAGDMSYWIQKNGFVSKEGDFNIYENTHIIDTLAIGKHDVSFVFLEKSTGLPAGEIPVKFGGQLKMTSATGEVLFSNSPGGKNDLTVSTPFFLHYEIIDVSSDTVLTILLEERTWDLGIEVYDSINEMPVIGADVTVDGILIESDLSGKSVFELGIGSHTIEVSKNGYITYQNTFTLARDTAFTVYLNLNSAELRFRIYEGQAPLNNVKVTLAETSKFSNALGLAVFNDLAIDVLYHYSLQKDGYVDIDSSLAITKNTIIDVQMKRITGINSTGHSGIKIYPNPVHGVLHVQSPFPITRIDLVSISGEVVYSSEEKARQFNLSVLPDLLPGAYFLLIYPESPDILYRELIIIQ